MKTLKFKRYSAEDADSLEYGRIISLSLVPAEGALLKANDPFKLMVKHQINGEARETFVSPEHFSALCSLMAIQTNIANTFADLPFIKVDDEVITMLETGGLLAL